MNRASPNADNLVGECILPDGQVLEVFRMLFNHRLCLSPFKGSLYIADAWCFATAEAALAEMHRWDPNAEDEPRGWIKHPTSGRYRKDGDPAQEEHT